MGKPRDFVYVEQLKENASKRITELRNVFRITQAGLAKRLGICRQAVYYYESGRLLISVEALGKIYDTFKVSPEWVLGLTDTDRAIERQKKSNY